MPLNPSWGALAFGHDGIFFCELVGHFAEGDFLLGGKLAYGIEAKQIEIPILCHLDGMVKMGFLCGVAIIAAFEIGGGLPELAVTAAVKIGFSAKNGMLFRLRLILHLTSPETLTPCKYRVSVL